MEEFSQRITLVAGFAMEGLVSLVHMSLALLA